MDIKRLCVIVLTTLSLSTINLQVFASVLPQPPAETEIATVEAWSFKRDKREKPGLTKEQKAELKAKWDALTQEQKEEVYLIYDNCLDSKIQLIDKYIELGIIDSETAARLRDNIEGHRVGMRENSTLPKIKMRG